MATKAFYEVYFSDFREVITKQSNKEVEQLTNGYILNVDENELLESLHNKYQIDPLIFHFENMEMDQEEKDVSIREAPDRFAFRVDDLPYNATARKLVITVYIPYTGNIDLLNCKPSSFMLNYHEVEYNNTHVYFKLVCWYDDTKIYQGKIESYQKFLRENSERLQKDCTEFNKGLRIQLFEAIKLRKEKASKNSSMIESLGIPLRRRNSSQTFAPVSVKRKIPIQMPTQYPKPSKPEPTIPETVYEDILRMINDIGKGFEKLPSTFKDCDENTLRDKILVFLQTNFEYEGTAESFNNSGKTDILLRYKNSNIFAAECKFWNGEKKMREEDISQLLSYLTWRDSKTSFIIFVKEKGITEILPKINSAFCAHPNFIKEVDKPSESWHNYEFHLNGDKNRIVKIGVLIFHFPR